ncbi:MAG: hypothetical protein AB2693_28190 [Candidatus Thiodiazotropha sp.]
MSDGEMTRGRRRGAEGRREGWDERNGGVERKRGWIKLAGERQRKGYIEGRRET